MEVGPSRRVENLAAGARRHRDQRRGPRGDAGLRRCAYAPGLSAARASAKRDPAAADARAAYRHRAQAGSPLAGVPRSHGASRHHHRGSENRLRTWTRAPKPSCCACCTALRSDPLDVLPAFSSACPRDLKGGSPAGHRMAGDRPATQDPAAAAWPSFADLAWDCDPALLPCFDRYLSAARQLGFACKIHADGADPWPPPFRSPHGIARRVSIIWSMPPNCQVRQLAEAGIIDHAAAQRDLRTAGRKLPRAH